IATLTIAGQTWTALVQANGTWNITPNALGAGSHTVISSVADPAGNIGTATQTLTVTTTTPPGGSVPPDLSTPPVDSSMPAIAPVGAKRVFDTRVGQSPNVMRTVARAKVGGASELQVRLTDLDSFVPATGVGDGSL